MDAPSRARPADPTPGPPQVSLPDTTAAWLSVDASTRAGGVVAVGTHRGREAACGTRLHGSAEHAAQEGKEAQAKAVTDLIAEILGRPEHQWFEQAKKPAAE